MTKKTNGKQTTDTPPEAPRCQPALDTSVDPMRLAQVTGIAVEHVGVSTADQIELVAVTIVENARKGGDVIIKDAQIQAGHMLAEAERLADDMNRLAANIRAYAVHKSQQVEAFCGVAENVMMTMQTLSEQYGTTRQAEAESFQQHTAAEPPLEFPSFLKRALKRI